MQKEAEAQDVCKDTIKRQKEEWMWRQTGEHGVGMPAHKRRASVSCDD